MRWRSYGAVALAAVTAWAIGCEDSTGPAAFAARMYIADIDTGSGPGTVWTYAAPYSGAGVPTDSLRFGGYRLIGVAVDAQGNLAVIPYTGPSRVLVYDGPVHSGDTPRDSMLFLGQGALPAFGSGGKLFVPTNSNWVYVYSPPFSSASVPDTIKTGLTNSYAIAFDAQQRLYVGDIGAGAVHVFNSPYTTAPAFSVTNGLTSSFNTGIAVDDSGRLYVADYSLDHILVYDPPLSGSSTAAFAITLGVESPIGVALGSDGRLYVVNTRAAFGVVPSVTIYDPPFSSLSTPTLTMSGGGQLVQPYGIAVGPR